MTDRPPWEDVPDLDDDLEVEAVEDGGETADLTALKDCLQALADAIASTNLAVIASVDGGMAGATPRVQASIAALKRFHDAFTVLKAEGGEEEAEDG